jgi:hypothetical protein
MFIILFIICLSFSFNINHHIDKSEYREVHPLFDKRELPVPPPKLKKGGVIHDHRENEYTVVSLHDEKYYDNVTWIIMINPKENKCKNNINIDTIKVSIENDGCFLYTSLVLNKNILIKIGCPSVFGNVFLKPKNTTFDGCQKVVKVRKKYYYNDLRDLIKTPRFNNTLSLLNGCYGEDNIIIEQNFAYHKPHSTPAVNNLLKNYYHHKKNYTKESFTKIKGYAPSPNQWKSVYNIKTIQTNPPWNLDRIDQRFGLDGLYHYNSGASDIVALIIDTGILATHVEFGGRAAFVVNAVGDGIDGDCHGHSVCNTSFFFVLITRHM